MNAREQAIAQVNSITNMVAALEIDYDRLDELQDLAGTTRFMAGCNMAGFMPDSEPAAFDDFDDAKRYVIGLMKDEEENTTSEEAAEDLSALAEDTNLESYPFRVTCQGMAFWVTRDGFMIDEEDGGREELAELERIADGCADADEARDRIMEDPLSVETRSGWVSVGDEMTADEYRIVLCTGGPHVEIVGDLDQHGTPSNVRIVFRDWGESGELFDFDHDAVLTYAQYFFN